MLNANLFRHFVERTNKSGFHFSNRSRKLCMVLLLSASADKASSNNCSVEEYVPLDMNSSTTSWTAGDST